MHILVTNDDGPPSPETSPYVHCLVGHLERAGHAVSVCLPHTQRSWIGKAHMIGQTLKPLYYRPGPGPHGAESEGTTHRRPAPGGGEWILIDGTPASCVQIGLHHFFQDKGPADLVVSGPNYGRNTSSVFALSSGTLGAALEAAICRRKAIALSFAFFSRNHDPVIIEAACRHSVRIIEALYRRWPADRSVDLYSVNVPLVEHVEAHKTLWTDMLQNYWRDGSCFQEIEGNNGDADEEEAFIREGPGGEADGDAAASSGPSDGRRAGHTHKHFKWAPRLTDVYQSVAESEPGNDGRTVREGNTSITPLKANFAQAKGAFCRKEFELPRSRPIRAIVAYDDSYVQPLIVSALESLLPRGVLDVVTDLRGPLSGILAAPDARVVQVMSYEAIDFESAASHPRACLVNSYMIRKALIRKHFLSATVDHWVAKRPASPLGRHVGRSEAFEVDYAEFLDDALVEAFDLRASMGRNAELPDGDGGRPREWWILKPGMSDRGQGIQLFSTMDELQAIFDGWEGGSKQGSGGEEEEDDHDHDHDHGGGIAASQLRHFVAQPYIHPPLLLASDPRKFHIRAYVLAVGSLSVYVYRPMLALFAGKPYLAPGTPDAHDADRFLTNTCLQRDAAGDGVRRFWGLSLPRATLDAVFDQICDVTGELFEAAARAMPVHFQTLPNAFEVFGLDFLVDADGVAWLLEVNAFPDFKQTGSGLQDVVAGFWRGVVRTAVMPFFGIDGAGDEDMVVVRQIDLGRR